MENSNKKVLIAFHRVDYDGLASYCIARSFFETKGYGTIDAFGYNYNDNVTMPNWDDYDDIVICDISFSIDIMQNLCSKYINKVFWIDHHITAIEDSEKYGYHMLSGKRTAGIAACVLTYKFFFELYNIPYVISLLGANDIWDTTSYNWDGEVQPLQYGLQERVGVDPDKLWSIWKELINENHKLLTCIIENGRSIMSYMNIIFKNWVDRFAFEIEVDGHLKGIAMISPVSGSRQFNSVINDYDVCVVVERDNKNPGTFNISMYLNHDEDFSCGQYMKDHYNGGGHKGAAGGKLNKEQFDKLITDCKL